MIRKIKDEADSVEILDYIWIDLDWDLHYTELRKDKFCPVVGYNSIISASWSRNWSLMSDFGWSARNWYFMSTCGYRIWNFWTVSGSRNGSKMSVSESRHFLSVEA